jgi:hypothetical protein
MQQFSVFKSLTTRDIHNQERFPVDKKQLKRMAQRTLPAPIHRLVGNLVFGNKYSPPAGMVQFGSLRRVTPISRHFGYDRGTPVDRYYIENFLDHHRSDIREHVLEIGDAAYTRQFGGNAVTKSDVLHVKEGDPEVTIIGDITNAPHIPDNTFDCFILTQTLQFIYDVPAALRTICRILKPGGVALVTIPGICHIAGDQWGDYQSWSFTCLSARRLFGEVFPEANVQVESFGNVLTTLAYLEGLAMEELSREELDYRDPLFPFLITVRAVKG